MDPDMTADKDYDLALSPIADFANHTVYDASSMTVFRNEEDGSLTFISPPKELKQGDELHLRYGNHPNLLLFSEYGFVVPRKLDDEDGGAEINVDDLVKEVIFTKPNNNWVKDVLEKAGYWG